MTRPPLRPTLLPSPPPARSEEARRRPRPGAGPAPRRVVGACIRPAHRAVRGDPVERDFMIAPREPAERDHAVRRDGLAGRAVYPDGIPIWIHRAGTADVGEGKRGVDVHGERSAVRQQELWTLLWTLWFVTRARHSQQRGCHSPPGSTNGAYHETPPAGRLREPRCKNRTACRYR